jgi:hypothetical protein
VSITPTTTLKALDDDELLGRLQVLVDESRRVEAELIAHLAEVDARRLYAREASPSMHAYCTEVLNLSDAEAYLRIAVARASREHPRLLAMLGDGRLHLTGAAKLAPHLTEENRDRLLERASRQSKRRIEELVAEVSPRPDAPALIRKLPDPPARMAPPLPQLRPDGAASVVPTPPRNGTPPATPRAPARVEPLAPARYKVQFTASAQLCEKLDRLRELMRASVPDGDLAAILEAAVTEKLERLAARRYAKTYTPRKSLAETDPSPNSRTIPAAVRRAVYERDGGQCTFVDKQGRRCAARDRLEFHHAGKTYGRGGDHSVANVALACPVHNQHLADLEYGRDVMDRHRRARSRVRDGVVACTVRGTVAPLVFPSG